MRTALVGQIIVGVATLAFGLLLFRGMVAEWHRRDREMHGEG